MNPDLRVVLLRKPGKAIILLSIFSLIWMISCSHIGHRAGVEPGPYASVLYAPSYERYEPPRRWPDYDEKLSGYGQTDFQLNLGHAWKFKNEQKFLLSGMFTIRPLFAPSVDLYWQFSSAPEYSNGGVGLILGVDEMAYFLWGRDLIGNAWDDFGMGVDAGLAFAAGPSFVGQPMISFRYKRVQACFFAEYRYYAKVLETCDENCGYDSYIRSRWVGGVMFMFFPSIVN